VQPHKGFIKAHISEFFNIRPFFPYSQSLLEGFADLFFLLLLYPFQDWSYIAFSQGFLCGKHYRAGKRIAMPKGLFAL
jgi:hypothetical protein